MTDHLEAYYAGMNRAYEETLAKADAIYAEAEVLYAAADDAYAEAGRISSWRLFKREGAYKRARDLTNEASALSMEAEQLETEARNVYSRLTKYKDV